MDFVSYLLFMFIGMLVAAFLGYNTMLWYWHRGRAEQKTWIEAMVAAVLAIFGASR